MGSKGRMDREHLKREGFGKIGEVILFGEPIPYR